MINYGLHIVFLLFAFQVTGQWKDITWEDFSKEAKNIEHHFQVEEYAVDVTYTSFKGKQTTTPYDKVTGYIQKTQGVQTSYINGVITIKNSEQVITVDSNNKIVTIGYAPTTSNEIITEQLNQRKELITSIQKQVTSKEKKYQLTYTAYSPIEKAILIVDQKDVIKSITVFYSQTQEYETSSGERKSDYVTLKMTYQNFQKKKRYNPLKINQILINTGKNPILAVGFKGFELIDFRPKY